MINWENRYNLLNLIFKKNINIVYKYANEESIPRVIRWSFLKKQQNCTKRTMRSTQANTWNINIDEVMQNVSHSYSTL